MVSQKVNNDRLRTARRTVLNLVGGFSLFILSSVVFAAPHVVYLLKECDSIVYVIDVQGSAHRNAPMSYFKGSKVAAHELAKVLDLPDTQIVVVDIVEGLGRQCS